MHVPSVFCGAASSVQCELSLWEVVLCGRLAALEWTKDAVRALIMSYREHPTLRNVKVPAYKDRDCTCQN